MAEESSRAHLIDLVSRSRETALRHDVDALMSFYAPDAVWDASDMGFGIFEGLEAIRGFFEDWWSTWEDHHQEVQESLYLGHGVVFGAIREEARLVGGEGRVDQLLGWVAQWADELIVRVAVYLNVDEARAVAERLAEERG
jgi:ketosteroid isomerase-like protein